jgi:hypothetical protein
LGISEAELDIEGETLWDEDLLDDFRLLAREEMLTEGEEMEGGMGSICGVERGLSDFDFSKGDGFSGDLEDRTLSLDLLDGGEVFSLSLLRPNDFCRSIPFLSLPFSPPSSS